MNGSSLSSLPNSASLPAISSSVNSNDGGWLSTSPNANPFSQGRSLLWTSHFLCKALEDNLVFCVCVNILRLPLKILRFNISPLTITYIFKRQTD